MDLTKIRRDRNYAHHYLEGEYPLCPRCEERCYLGEQNKKLHDDTMQPDRPAMSRVDGSEICAECGTEEALTPLWEPSSPVHGFARR